MITEVPELQNADVTVMGLGLQGGGTAVTRYLSEKGANVTVTDLKSADELRESIDALSDLDVHLVLGEHREDDFREPDVIIVNPAVPLDSPFLDIAREHQVPLESELNLFVKQCPAHVTGITGTAGKSTTTSLIGTILANDPESREWVGGNIGRSLLPVVDQIQTEDRVVLEISSFQLLHLDRIQWSPDLAVLTNITPNHLDRHGDFSSYKEAKRTIIKHQDASDAAIFNSDDDLLRSWHDSYNGTAFSFSTETSVETGAWLEDGTLFYRKDPDGEKEKILEQEEIPVPGRFNIKNVLAALCACRGLGVSGEVIRESVRTFEPLPHHLEVVEEKQGIRFIDDSVSTTPESTMAALSALEEERPVVILGGYDKGSDPSDLVEKVTTSTSGAVVLGDTKEKFLDAFRRVDHEIPLCTAESLPEAVRKAVNQIPASGGTVLLSTACASYDMFRNYKERGKEFQQIVSDLMVDE